MAQLSVFYVQLHSASASGVFVRAFTSDTACTIVLDPNVLGEFCLSELASHPAPVDCDRGR